MHHALQAGLPRFCLEQLAGLYCNVRLRNEAANPFNFAHRQERWKGVHEAARGWRVLEGMLPPKLQALRRMECMV